MDITDPSTAVCDIKEMEIIALNIAKKLSPGSVVALSGDLGSGKTTFTKMLCRHLSIKSSISSPTYSYLNIYDDKIAHFDLYRLKTEADFFSLGFEHYLDSSFIVIIEWPNIIKTHLPAEAIKLTFSHHKNNRRISSNEELLV